MICAFNARGFLMDPAMKSAFGLNNKADDKTIQKQLILKKISYGSLNGALVPDQDKDKAIPHNSKCRYGERGAADAVPQLPERCLSRKAGIMRCCHKFETCFVFNSEQMDSFASGKQRSRSNIIRMLERWML